MNIKFIIYTLVWKAGEILSLYYGPLSIVLLILSILTKNLFIFFVTFIYLSIFLRKIYAYPNQNILKCLLISFKRKKLWTVDVKGGLRADIYLAEQATSSCLIFFYGGGFISGSIKQHQDLCEYWSKGNFHIAYLEYPLAQDGDFQNCLNKSIEAVEYLFTLRTNKFAPKKFSIGGRSAGGYLALKMASSNLATYIDNVIVFYPPVKISNWLNLPSSKFLLPTKDLNIFFKASSHQNLDISENSLNKNIDYYFYLAQNDSMVPIDETLKLITTLKKVNFKIHSFIFKNCNHGFEANPFSLEGQKVCHLIHQTLD